MSEADLTYEFYKHLIKNNVYSMKGEVYNFHLRVDVVTYEEKRIHCYELKLTNVNAVIKQVLNHRNVADLMTIVIATDKIQDWYVSKVESFGLGLVWWDKNRKQFESLLEPTLNQDRIWKPQQEIFIKYYEEHTFMFQPEYKVKVEFIQNIFLLYPEEFSFEDRELISYFFSSLREGNLIEIEKFKSLQNLYKRCLNLTTLTDSQLTLNSNELRS